MKRIDLGHFGRRGSAAWAGSVLASGRQWPAAAVLLLSVTFPVQVLGQWQWIDKEGRRVFSDKAPPPEVPSNKIVRQPGVKPAASADRADPQAAATPAVAAVPASAPAAPAKVGELEERKKRADQAAEAKKKEAAQQVANAEAENCSRARQAKATYDSGARVARVNAKGEREILDDKARADEVKRLEAVIARDCKAG